MALAVTAEVKERETWSGRLDFVLALVGYSVGLGNIWRFPYLCYKNGGGAFLIPYFLCLILAGFPLLVLEVALGQFMKEGGITVWKICPLFSGVGYASVIMNNFLIIYYIIILAWALFYMFASFTSHLPWSDCGNTWNTPRCSVDGVNLGNVTSNATLGLGNATYGIANGTTTSPIVEYWENRVLKISGGLEEMGAVDWEMALCLLLGWIICYLCVCKGIKSSGRVVYFTATFPYVLITILLIRAVTLPGAANGIKFYLKPDMSRLTDGQVWLDACTQVFFSYSMALGTMMALGSYNKFRNNCLRDCVIFACMNSGTSLYGGFVIFSVLGFMAGKQGVPVDKVASSGPGLAFIAYPAAVSEMPAAPLWSILFFFMLILLGLDSEFVSVEGVTTAITDKFPHYIRVGYRKEILTAVMCCIWFLLGLPMVTKGGMYVFQLFDYYSASGSALLWVSLFESIAIGWVYGGKRFYEDLYLMLGFRISPWLRWCWTYITPTFCMGTFIFSLVTYKPLTYNQTYKYPEWGEAIGWCLALSSILAVPIVMIGKILMQTGSLRERWAKLTTPTRPKHALEVEMEDRVETYLL